MPEPGASAAAPTVLVVDDENWNLTLVESVLDDTGYRIITATDGAAALDLVASESAMNRPPDAIVLDIMMPGMDGYEVCRRLKSSRRTYFIPIVLLTALADTGSKVKGLEAGADDFLGKPINRIELLTRLRSLLAIRALRARLDSAESVIYSLVAALESKDPRMSRLSPSGGTGGHSLRVAALVAAVVEDLRLTGPDLESLIWAALLHDIGKIGVPDEVLETPPERRGLDAHRLFQLHPLYSERILKPLASLAPALPIIRHHHERLDGSGYPDGISGRAFTPPMQVVAAANAYENFRLESPGAGPETWASQLRAAASAGKFHPSLVEGIIRAEASLSETLLSENLPEIVDLLPVPAATAGGRILIADDSATNRDIYEEILTDAGYAVRVFPDGNALLDAARERSPDLVITDVRMPGIGGEELCRRLKSDPRLDFLPVILITAHIEAASKERALASGADEFLSVPVDRHELLARVRSLMRLGAFHSDLEQQESVVLSLSGMLEAKDPATNGHSVRVAELAVRLAREMGLGEETVATLRTAGLLHDIGKVAIPERVLHESILNRQELELLEAHPQLGYDLCKGLHSARAALPAIRHHHEQCDGSGYPDGLAGDAIPLGARVLGLANAFDVLTVRGQLLPEEAVEHLSREAREGKWDPEVTRAFEALHREDRLR